MSSKALIGYWIEKAPRELEAHTSFAADWITHRTRPGRYPVYMTFEGGYTVPMPYWVLCGIDSDVTAGKTYSALGGNIFASRDVKREPSKYHVQTYTGALAEMIDNGTLEVLPGLEWVRTCHEDICNGTRKVTWDNVREMAKVQP